MTERSTLSVRGVDVPGFLYGTAWKEDQTERLTRLALEAGFRGIDTANQRRHYFEAGVGAAVQQAIRDGLVRREQLFLQTKFTHVRGQDHRLPYDPKAPMAKQVRQSFASSLQHLGVETLDSYVLHGPSSSVGLTVHDREVWAGMQELHAEGKTRLIGVSNVSKEQLQELVEEAAVPPAFVQNRCFARLAWDREVRAICQTNGVVYQGFSLLTANGAELQSGAFRRLVARVAATPAQVVFAFARRVGMLPLTGTTDPAHMREDLESDRVDLSDEDVQAIERIAWAS